VSDRKLQPDEAYEMDRQSFIHDLRDDALYPVPPLSEEECLILHYAVEPVFSGPHQVRPGDWIHHLTALALEIELFEQWQQTPDEDNAFIMTRVAQAAIKEDFEWRVRQQM
jgi:hypothetical protein